MKEYRELVAVRVDIVQVVVTTRQERERRERAQALVPIKQESIVDWRSYERREVPARWRVR